MEVFPDFTFSGDRVRPVLIGGFRGTAATRVELTLRDGSAAAASVDSGRVVPGSTVFWALTPVPATRVRAYDASGTVVADHRLSACYSRVDCQIR